MRAGVAAWFEVVNTAKRRGGPLGPTGNWNAADVDLGVRNTTRAEHNLREQMLTFGDVFRRVETGLPVLFDPFSPIAPQQMNGQFSRATILKNGNDCHFIRNGVIPNNWFDLPIAMIEFYCSINVLHPPRFASARSPSMSYHQVTAPSQMTYERKDGTAVRVIDRYFEDIRKTFSVQFIMQFPNSAIFEHFSIYIYSQWQNSF
jgi:hypothetical protein